MINNNNNNNNKKNNNKNNNNNDDDPPPPPLHKTDLAFAHASPILASWPVEAKCVFNLRQGVDAEAAVAFFLARHPEHAGDSQALLDGARARARNSSIQTRAATTFTNNSGGKQCYWKERGHYRDFLRGGRRLRKGATRDQKS